MKALLEFSERFGSMLSRLLLSALYYLVLGPVALVYQRVRDPLRLKRPKSGSNWSPWRQANDSLPLARRQD
ncbi:MAG: hypothetical protein AAFZ87_02755 [Planctomycetota bacterium]